MKVVGNCLMELWEQQHLDQKKEEDRSGHLFCCPVSRIKCLEMTASEKKSCISEDFMKFHAFCSNTKTLFRL